MVGAAYLSGKLEKLEEWVLAANQLDVVKFFGVRLTGSGFVDTERFEHFLDQYVVADGQQIEKFAKPFATVATDVNNGREVWFTEGSVLNAVRASMAMPGLFATVSHAGRWLVDGGLVNPVPVSVCHALGADFVIAVNLNAGILGKRERNRVHEEADGEPGILERVRRSAKEYSDSVFPSNRNDAPGTFDVVANSINIFQDRITRSRLAGDLPDIVIAPKLAHIGMLDFHRAEEAIREGEDRTKRVIDDIAGLARNTAR
jgi:NTE family protein